MDIRHSRRLRAALVSTVCLASIPAAVHASTLAAFSFESNGGVFDAAPGAMAPGVASAVWRDDAGRLGDLAGNPGRALSASGFTGTNQLHLVLEQSGTQRWAPSLLHFDIRGSASGPNAWTLSQAGATLAFGQEHVPQPGLLGLVLQPLHHLRGLPGVAGGTQLTQLVVNGQVWPLAFSLAAACATSIHVFGGFSGSRPAALKASLL